jgi:hypothetical protein
VKNLLLNKTANNTGSKAHIPLSNSTAHKLIIKFRMKHKQIKRWFELQIHLGPTEKMLFGVPIIPQAEQLI